jgi:phosphonate transport system ATP-binding protein
MLEISHVNRVFGTKRAVDDVSLRIDKGSFVGVIGRSGAGKSTLLRMINRLQDVSSGTIYWNGKNVTALKGQALRDWRASCAMVFQQFNIVGRLDVMTNVLMGRLNQTTQMRSLLKLWTAEDRAIAVSALEQFDMTTAMAGTF